MPADAILSGQSILIPNNILPANNACCDLLNQIHRNLIPIPILIKLLGLVSQAKIVQGSVHPILQS